MSTTDSSQRIPGWAWLVLLVAASTALRAWGALQIDGPWIAPDEMIYALLGLGLYDTGHLAILGGPTPFYSLLTPAFVGLPLSLGGTGAGYEALKVLQALVMSLAAVPVYFWARSLVTRGWALAAAALTLSLPGLAYTGLVMTEVLFYPVLTLAAWAMASALARPTPRAQLLLVVAVAAAASVRLQAVILLPAFVSALALHAALERSTQTVRRLWPALAALTALAALWLGWRLAAGASPLAGYARIGQTSYSVGAAARFVAYHAGSLLILSGMFPVCALAVLLGQSLRRRESSAGLRAYLAVATSLAVWFVLEVGVFASAHVGRLAERDLLALAPMLFVGFAVWLGRGAPGSFALCSAVAVVAAALVLSVPLDRMVTVFGLQDAFTLVPLWRLREATSLGTLELVVWIGTAVAVFTFVLLPRRLAVVLPLLLVAAFSAASVSATRYIRTQAAQRQADYLGSEPRWIDRSARGSVAYVYDGDPNWDASWHTLFWNRRIRWVLDLPGAELQGPVPQHATVVRPDGRLVVAGGSPSRLQEVAIPTGISLFGRPLAQIAQRGLHHAGLTLWSIEPPLRISTRTFGLQPNGDIFPGGDGKLLAYDCRSGYHFLVTVLVKSQTTVRLFRNGRPYRTLMLRPSSGGAWRERIPTVEGTGPAAGTCTLDLRSTGLVGTTVFDVERG